MIKEELKKHQKVAYQILENALLSHTLAHAYLFTGEAGTPKLECAYLLIQSLLCDEKGFACETCEKCQHVTNGGYADFIYVDGKTKSIKKSDIVNIQERFSKTQLEANGKKVYILDGVENATAEALNSLLKFLEEPESDTLAILISEHSDRILETIVSRTQVIPFYKRNDSELETLLMQEMDACNAHILAHISMNREQALARFESDEFQHAYYLFSNFLQEYAFRPAMAKVFLQRECATKGKRDDKAVMVAFFDMLILLCRDYFRMSKQDFENIWGKNAQVMVKLKVEKLLPVCNECKDKIGRSINIPLLVDQFLYTWEDENGKA